MSEKVTQHMQDVQHTLDLVMRLPMAVLWCVIVGVLAIITIRGGRVLFARRLALVNAMVCLGATAVYLALVVLRPAWFVDWMGDLTFVTLGAGFIVGLNAVIWSRMEVKSAVEGWRHFGMALCIGGFVIANLLVSAELPVWLTLVAATVIAGLVGIGFLAYRRTEGRVDSGAA